MFKNKVLVGTLAAVIFTGGIGSSFHNVSAAEKSPTMSPQIPAELASDQEAVDQMAGDLEFIFNEATTLEDGKYILDKQKAADKFGAENVPSLEVFIKITNGEEVTAGDLSGVENPSSTVASKGIVMAAASGDSWSECVGQKVIDATGIGFISGGMWKLIERKAWKKLAYELAKVAGKNAIKGGIVGFSASLAWYSVRCA
ncbi:hypothetical protein VKA52_12605 [Halobacillus sp. HZG1]|uniref:hypothetical protein n=1 Tax=Halobacillus sp. HZG1 TaxID=3111769 RepID=UPI002DB5962F|nr:hypothetical protein [Halobacillus sp. HZG1]MEC3884567.1 hypothetical protein [Halobacillus sp. HZG1]